MDLHFLAKHAQKHCSICAYNVYESDWEDHWTKIPAHRLCKGCDLAFETSESYIQHSAVPHTQLRCKICSATFLNTELLEFHVKKSHNYCNLCDAQFTFYRELAYHSLAKHPESHAKLLKDGGISKCHLCQVVYQTPLALQQHMLAKHAGAKNVAPIVLVDSDNNSVVGPTESPIVNKTLPTQISQAASLRSNSNSSAHSSASAAASLSKAIPVIESHSVSPAPSSISLSSAAISDAVMVKTDAASSDDLLSLRDDQSDVDDDKTSVVSEDLRRDANKAAGPPAPLMVMRCALCKDSPADPVLTMCGHIFCHGCLMPEVSRSLQCPSCKRPLFVRIDVPVS
ncbi:hypothetical protein EUX98_g5638 [Antrodiella citrinella]|uniref:RING-type domain-containing protein n=1 Tax=Antrodiella citrinella TaxID=2447956 RepID=A0A4S4MRA2_9APHY|nr:hypothetical protein EUX98_g5638 [Antrodiella citrinella]